MDSRMGRARRRRQLRLMVFGLVVCLVLLWLGIAVRFAVLTRAVPTRGDGRVP